jgi:hypothetical protein
LVPEAENGEESDFLQFLLTDSIPERLRGFFSSPSITPLSQLVWLVLLTGLVGFGYLYGIVKWG